MNLKFHKINSNGNDFILIDNARIKNKFSTFQIKNLCSRRFFIGADGLILLKPSDKFDYKMQIFNSDGLEADMCGNAILCVGRYIFDHDKSVKPKKKYLIETKKKFFDLTAQKNKVSFLSDIPKILKKNILINLKNFKKKALLIDSSVLHLVIFVSNLDELDIFKLGREIKSLKEFKSANITFCEKERENKLKVRVYENGVEDETYCCSTGALAAAKGYDFLKNHIKNLDLKFLGGNIKINFKNNYFKLTGQPKYNFEGTLRDFF